MITNKRDKKISATVLLTIGAACCFFAVWELDFICSGLRLCFFLGYLATTPAGVLALMETKGDLPDYPERDDD